MSRIRVVVLALLATAFTVSAAHAVDLNGKKGLGYAESINGANGIAFNYGLGNLFLEGMLGVTLDSPKDNDGMGRDLAIGLGAHFQALRAEEAAWTIGGRIAIANGVAVTPKGADAPDGVTQFGIDIPTRVYWFPNKHISLHAETGISLQFAPKEGNALGNLATPDGSAFVIFDTTLRWGMTFWW